MGKRVVSQCKIISDYVFSVKFYESFGNLIDFKRSSYYILRWILITMCKRIYVCGSIGILCICSFFQNEENEKEL